MYTENDLVRIAKRENNTKRKYLVVNPQQGKHIPVRPSTALDLFAELSASIADHYPNESILFIGFAETATAIGAAVAVQLSSSYMQTTREQIDGVEYFYFSESHSHATEQKLVKDDLDSMILQVDRIVFIEDEVTTGNTILNIIHLLQAEYGHAIRFAVASLLNGMEEQALRSYQEQNINLHYLVKTDHSHYEWCADRTVEDGKYLDFRKHPKDKFDKTTNHCEFDNVLESCITITCGDYQDARRVVMGIEYKYSCQKLWDQIEASIKDQVLSVDIQRVLVLGTEEFMYPALYTAERLEAAGKDVLFHATTRSPITVSKSPDYPLHMRCCLTSVYEEDRTTYLYNIGVYDMVLIITDAKAGSTDDSQGLQSLIQALVRAGNTRIYAVRWC